MIAALLYFIGLVALLVSIAVAGYTAPQAITDFTTAMDTGNANMLDVSMTIAAGFAWAVLPIVGGLCLMGLARVIMLLGAINRSLRGQV
jgi:hypothetical protein